MLDGISTGIDRGLDTGFVDGVDRNLEMVAMCLFDGRGKLRNCEVLIGRDLDDVYVMKHILPDCLSRPVDAVNQQEFLLKYCVGQCRIQALKVVTASNQFSSRSQHPRTRDAPRVDSVAQLSVTVDPRMTQIT